MKNLLFLLLVSVNLAAQDSYRIGPTTDKPFNIKIGSVKVGKIGSPSYSYSQTAFGYEASNKLLSTVPGVTTFGYQAGAANVTMGAFTAFGTRALSVAENGGMSVAVGSQTLANARYVQFSTAIGHDAMGATDSSSYDLVAGFDALFHVKKSGGNTVIGAVAGMHIGIPFPSGTGICTEISTSTLLGSFTRPLGNNESNAIAVGFNAVTMGSNTAVIGNEDTKFTALKGATLVSGISGAKATLVESIDGMIVYITETFGVFTKKGFWGKENNQWVKL